jgi:fluoroquinolone transport system permease protein
VTRVLPHAIGWDLRLQARHQVVTVAVVVSLAYAILFRAVPAELADPLTVMLVFSDPTVFGFLFVGVLVLFERGAGTLEAVVVTPLSPGQYLWWSKAISLTLIAMGGGLVMAIGGHGLAFSAAPLLAGLALTSVLFVFIGFAAVMRIRTLNAYLLIVPQFLLPLTLPLLNYSGLVESWLFYLIPTQGTLVLFERAFTPRPAWEWFYAVGYLGLAAWAAYRWALRSFETYVRGAR